MKTYHYPHDFRTKHHNYLSLFLSSSFLLVLVVIAIADYQSLREELPIGMLIILLALFGAIYDLYRINLYPNVTTSELGLGVEFLSFYIPVLWENVESVHMLQSSYYPEKFTEWFVRTKKLTPFHLLYGKNRYGDFVTGFLVRSDMESVQELLDIIGGKVPANKYQPSKKAEYFD